MKLGDTHTQGDMQKGAWPLFLLILFYASFFLKPVSLTGVDGDLGRHLRSGELFFTHFAPATANRFSYTYPDHRIVDHHWGAGVLFYLVYALGGFLLLHIFSVGISLLTFLIFFKAARKQSSFEIAFFVESGSMAEAPPGYLPYKIIFWIVVLLLAFGFIFNGIRRKRFVLREWIIAVTFGVLAYLKVRTLAFFGFLCAPILSVNLCPLVKDKHIRPAFIYLLAVLIAAVYVTQFKNEMHWNVFDLGVKKGTFDSIRFFKDAKLKGPIFNNFKSGGLLIFSLFPQEKVFVDQRLEAYPPELHDKRNYLRESAWRKWDQEYHFNVIFFAVPFKKSLEAEFLTARLRDPEWAIVYADETALVLVRNNEANGEVIRKYHLE